MDSYLFGTLTSWEFAAYCSNQWLIIGKYKMKLSHRLFLYAVLVILISPIQFHMDWIDGSWIKGMPVIESISEVLQKGGLFFYAVVLGLAMFFELNDHPYLQRNSWVFGLKICCWLPLILFVVLYMSIRLGVRSPDKVSLLVQVYVGIFSVLIAIASKLVIYIVNDKSLHSNPLSFPGNQ